MAAHVKTSVLELTFLDGPQPGRVERIARDAAVLGRSAQADVPVHDASASRQHARLARTGTDYQIENLSHNGIRVNGREVTCKILKDGDVIEFGRAVRIRVRYLVQESTVVESAGAFDLAPGHAFDEPASAPAAAQAKPTHGSLFRRPKVVIGLAAYGVALLVLMLMLETHEPTGSAPPGLDRAAMAGMMEAYFAADSRVFQFESDGRTRRAPDARRAAEALARAREAFNTAPVSDRSLWKAAYSFREAQAYDADGALRDPDDVQRFRHAREALTRDFADRYVQAMAAYRRGRLKEARDAFARIRDAIPDRNHPLVVNVGQWLQFINRRLAG